MSLGMKIAQQIRRNRERIAKGLPPKAYAPVVDAIAKKIEAQSLNWVTQYRNGLYRLTIAGHYYRVECRFTRNAVSFICPITLRYCTLTLASFEMYKPHEECNTVVHEHVRSEIIA